MQSEANNGEVESPSNESPSKEIVEEAAAKALTGAEASEPLREDQIQNAISFLNHPKVQGSSQAAKTKFLDKKGLTAAEIKEAFTRAGSSSAGTSAIASTASPALPQAPRPAYNGTQATISALQPRQVLQQMPPVSRSLRWTQVVLGASVVVAGAYALKQLVTPIASKWYRQFYGIKEADSNSENIRQQETRTAELVASAIESQTKELRATIDSLKDMVSKLEKRKQDEVSETSGVSIEDLRSELHAFASTLTSSSPQSRQPDTELKAELAQIKQLLSSRASGHGGNNPMSPKVKSTGSAYPPYQGNGNTRVGPPAARAHHQAEVVASGDSEPSQPSYMEVLEMLERGETPPNVRTDIDDKPPNPNQALPNAVSAPRAKPWERAGASSSNPSSTGQPAITESDDGRMPAHRKNSTGPWRPPPVPQASVPKAASIASEAGSDTASVQNADKIEEVDS